MDQFKLDSAIEISPTVDQAADPIRPAADEITPLPLECLGLVGGGQGVSVV